jgi:holo-[acyl-carrier protein] synthase
MPHIFGIGLDIVDIARIAELRQRHGDSLGRNIFLPEELDYCLSRANADECLAARFAAKEAVMKALGTGWAEGVSFMGIEVTREASGKPGITLHGATLEKAKALGVGKIHVSLSHAREAAVAQVLIEAVGTAGENL